MTGRGHWTRDFAVGGGFANFAGVTSVLGIVGWQEGVVRLTEYAGWIAATTALFVVTGTLFGALAGRAGQGLLEAVGERWGWLVPVGFPLGAAVGVAEMWVAVLTVLPEPPYLVRVLGVAGMAGGLVLGFAWPVYLVLDVSDRPGWAALIAAPMVAPFAVASIVGVIEWTT